ncbi:MAG TPA: hypothetical protein VKF36_14320 [Syntrophorhabdales bacterium]|nr:hypothetical protein [Syntrophorhabdales bacterium]
MSKSFVKEWTKLIRPLFPESAEIIEKVAGDDVVLLIDWKLGPKKRSRLIRVIVSKEAITDCRDFKVAGSQFEKIIRDKLSVFNPDHDTPEYGSRPTEEWVVKTSDVN